MFAGNPLPGRFPEFMPEADRPVLFVVGEKDTPMVVRHFTLPKVAHPAASTGCACK